MYTKFAVVAALAAYAEALNLQNEAEPAAEWKTGAVEYRLFSKNSTWEEAKASCAAQKAHLAHPKNAAENDSIKSHIKGSTWIGLNDHAKEGHYVWQGEPAVAADHTNNAKSLSYSNWARHEPNNWGGHEDCVEMWPNGQWNDVQCNYRHSKKAYVCQQVQKAEPAHSGAVFGDLSFLDGLDSFNDAQSAREKYVAEQERLDKVRTEKAKIYFGTKQRALSAARAKAYFNTALEAKISAHEEAKAAHEKAASDHELAKAETGTKAGVLAAAIEAQRLSGQRKTEAHAAVGHAQGEVKHSEKTLFEAEATFKAAKKEMHEATEVDNAAIHAVQTARKAHSAAQLKEAEAKDKVAAKKIAQEDAREARMDAEDKKEAADNAAHEAEEAKSDAYAAAVRAHYAKIAHAKANTQHHL